MTLSFDASRLEGLLFDLDGTLVDSLPDLHHGMELTLASRGLAPMSEEELGTYIGKGIPHLVRTVLGRRKPGFTEAEAAGFMEEYLDNLAASLDQRSRLMPGVAQALEGFRSAGLPLALVTNKSGRLVDHVVEKLGLGGFFPAGLRISADDVGRAKPAPDMLLLAARRMGVRPENCAMFGDSRNDAESARAAGAAAVLLETGYNEGEPIGKWGPANGFRDIFPTIDVAAREILRLRR